MTRGLRGLGLRGDHPAALRLRRRVRRTAPSARKTYSFVGRDGSLLALRPDFTSLLAKIAAGRLAERPAADPALLLGRGAALRAAARRAARASSTRWGSSTWAATRDRATRRCWRSPPSAWRRSGSAGIVLALGHVGVFAGLVEGCDARPRAARAAARAGREQGRRGRRRRARAERGRPPRVTRRAHPAHPSGRRPRGAGRGEARLRASPAARAPRSRSSWSPTATSRRPASGDQLAIDLGEVRGLDYYTGLVFRAYARGLGFEVGGGGRYDSLLARFGRPMPAVGFMLGLDRLALLLERQGALSRTPRAAPRCRSRATASGRRSAARAAAARGRKARVRFGTGTPRGAAMSLTIALSKGKLLAGTEALFRALGAAVPRGRRPPPRGRAATACASSS